MDGNADLIAAIREHRAQRKARKLALDSVTNQLVTQSRAGLAKSRELLERSRQQVEAAKWVRETLRDQASID